LIFDIGFFWFWCFCPPPPLLIFEFFLIFLLGKPEFAFIHLLYYPHQENQKRKHADELLSVGNIESDEETMNLHPNRHKQHIRIGYRD
jgi:hypothetical protein